MSLKQLCKDKKITFTEISKETGISTTYLSRLNTGNYNNPSSEIVEKISSILKVTNDEVIKAIRG